eukprot:symbB.v1.2.012170.t1/scaffold832.1/size159137/15
MLPLCCFSGQTPCHGTELGLEREKGALSCTNPRLTLDATDDLSSLMQGLSIWGERQFLAVFSPRFQHETLGIDFDISDPKVCVVVRIDPFGQAATWNQTAGRKQIKLHDRLVSVNDQRLRAADLVQKVQTSGSLELMFERPDIFDFAYDRKGQQTVGLTLAPCKDYEAFVIETIHPSGIVSSKPLQASEKRPQAHDWIIEINGRRNNKKDMSKLLAAERVLMKLCRYDLES